MIEIRDIRKSYKTGDFVQKALDGVSITFRESEFVAVLGPSGSGKTTFLNILGGFDHADSGDIIVNDVSTKDYSDKDWDTYRNHRIGFVFQATTSSRTRRCSPTWSWPSPCRASAAPSAASVRARRSSAWAWATMSTRGRRSSPAGRCSAWQSREPS